MQRKPMVVMDWKTNKQKPHPQKTKQRKKPNNAIAINIFIF